MKKFILELRVELYQLQVKCLLGGNERNLFTWSKTGPHFFSPPTSPLHVTHKREHAKTFIIVIFRGLRRGVSRASRSRMPASSWVLQAECRSLHQNRPTGGSLGEENGDGGTSLNLHFSRNHSWAEILHVLLYLTIDRLIDWLIP